MAAAHQSDDSDALATGEKLLAGTGRLAREDTLSSEALNESPMNPTIQGQEIGSNIQESLYQASLHITKDTDYHHALPGDISEYQLSSSDDISTLGYSNYVLDLASYASPFYFDMAASLSIDLSQYADPHEDLQPHLLPILQ